MPPKSGPNPSEERLLVSVLFADIVGFSSLADQLEPKQVSEVTGGLWLEFDQIIKEYGGVIDKQLGDTLMVVWGAPESQEDDAERAVSASLALLDGLTRFKENSKIPAAKSLRLRVGIHTGLALAGHVGVKGEYTVIGDTVNIAKRMEESAEPGTLIVSEATYQSIRGAFQVKRLTPVQLLGTKALVNIFQILDELQQPTKLRYRTKGGLETNLVGRENEMDQLAELYQKMEENSKPQLVLVTGDVGVGKSRLLFEFAGYLETQNPLLTVMASRALEQTSRVPYALWKELWANRFELNEDDPLDVTQKKIIDGVRTFWGRTLGDVTAVEAAHFLGSLIGIRWEKSRYLDPFVNNPKSMINRAYLMLEELFFRASQRGPVVLILDDLQWADPGSLALIKHLWRSAEQEIPLLILSSARSEFLLGEGQDFQEANRIDLLPLPINIDIVRDAYPALRNSPVSMLKILAKKSGGNPYFMEELVKLVLPYGEEAEVVLKKLPDSLDALLKYRLDSLSLEGRATAYFAAVAGRVFWKGSVMAAFRGSPGVTKALDVSSHNLVGKVQKALDEMMEKELAFLRVGSVFSGDREYIFKHSRLHEVALSRLPDDFQEKCNLAVGLWLAERAGPERSICVAQHFEKAGIIDKAQEFYTLAAEHARSVGCDEEADDIQYYARTLPEDR